MKTNYLYIGKSNIKIGDNSILYIRQVKSEKTFEELILFIKNEQNSQLFNGLMIDYDLNKNFKGISIAQEIRTRQKEYAFKAFPIILVAEKEMLELIKKTYNPFDIGIDKALLSGTIDKKLLKKFYGLAEGYKFLSKCKDIAKILNIDISVIDDRFVSELSQLLNNPVHIISQFIIYELIEKQGLLIKESVLAARLGIDIEFSQDWDRVKDSLASTKYNGTFSEGCQRWWAPLIEEWWKETVKSKTYLRSTPATERVALIKNALQLENIQSAQKIDKADSEEFWIVCKGYDKPLDPVDGLIIEGQEKLYPWQDVEYVSIDAALKRQNISVWKNVAKIEENHLKELQGTYIKTI